MNEIHINGHKGEPVHLFIDGERVATVHLGQVTTPKDWEAELMASRASRAAATWLNDLMGEWNRAEVRLGPMSPKEKRVAWADGLRSGLVGDFFKTSAGVSTPGVPPTHATKAAAAFASGWHQGDALRRAAEMGAG